MSDHDSSLLEELRDSKAAVIDRHMAAAVLGCDERTLTKAVADGQIPAIRLGRRVLIPRERFLALFDRTAA